MSQAHGETLARVEGSHCNPIQSIYSRMSTKSQYAQLGIKEKRNSYCLEYAREYRGVSKAMLSLVEKARNFTQAPDTCSYRARPFSQDAQLKDIVEKTFSSVMEHMYMCVMYVWYGHA